jgi:hypothetical protein
MATMTNENIASLRTHRNNISRYRRLLKTSLTDLEREFIERRLTQERSAFQALASDTFPVAFNLPVPNQQLLPRPLDRRKEIVHRL